MLSSIILSMAMSVSPASLTDTNNLEQNNINHIFQPLLIEKKRGEVRIEKKRGEVRIEKKRGEVRIEKKRGEVRI